MKKSLTLIFAAILFVSCKEDTTPAWLEIPAIELSTDEDAEGANSHGICDAWVYMDNNALGVFELPAKIPVLAEGEHTFIIFAGVKNNGISATRVKYPFYDNYQVTLNLERGKTTTITPVVTYKKNLNFEMIEDFEDTGIEFNKTNISDTSIVFIDKTDYPSIVVHGQRCGGIFLTETDSIFKAQTSTYLNLPKNEDVYLEIDFMNNNSMVTSTIAQNSLDYTEHAPLAGFVPQDLGTMVWKKMYVPLIENVSYEVYATSYEIYLLSVLDPENTSATIYVDNIKVICYQ